MGEFARELGRAMHRPILGQVPLPLARLALGEFAYSISPGQKVHPAVAERVGYAFSKALLRDALAAGPGAFKLPSAGALVSTLAPIIEGALKDRGIPVTVADIRYAVSVVEEIAARGTDAPAVRQLLAAHGFAEVQSRDDLAGIARCSGGIRRTVK